MNTNSTKLSLKLPPEVAKIMPWIIQAKVSGKPGSADWAKEEYERAADIARQRERWEREREEDRRVRAQQEAFWREYGERVRQAKLEEERLQPKRLDACSAHLYCNEDGEEEFLPSHGSSNGGLRRQWARSQEAGLRDHSFWERKWLADAPRSNERWGKNRYHPKRIYRDHSHNNGRKPRKPWFKKTRAQH